MTKDKWVDRFIYGCRILQILLFIALMYVLIRLYIVLSLTNVTSSAANEATFKIKLTSISEAGDKNKWMSKK